MLIGSINNCPPNSYGFYECTLDSIDAKDCPLDQDLNIYCSNCKHCHCINLDLNKNNYYNEKQINYFIDIYLLLTLLLTLDDVTHLWTARSPLPAP